MAIIEAPADRPRQLTSFETLIVIRSPLGLRIQPDPSRSSRDQIREAATLGAKGVILDANGDFAPERLGDTGRRDLAGLLRSVELRLIALNLPTRRAFDTFDDLDQRLARADRAFALAYELGSRMIVARAGSVPSEDDPKRAAYVHALTELGKRADHRGIRLAIELGSDPGTAMASVLDAIASPGLGASVDPASALRVGIDPASTVGSLASWLIHAYAGDATSGGNAPANPRGLGFAPGVLDWEAYLGSLEEVEYRGFLTIWPDPTGDVPREFKAIKAKLDRF